MWNQYRWYIIGGVAAAILLGAIIFVYNLIAYERELAIAKEKESQAKVLQAVVEESQKKFDEYVKQSQEQIQEMGRQQAALAQAAVLRQQAYQGKVETVQRATSTEDIIKQMSEFLKIKATDAGGGNVTMPALQAQGFVILQLENQKLKDDITDLRNQFAIEQRKTSSLQEQLDRAMVQISETRKLADEWKTVAESYKKAAVKSKWKRAVEIAVPVGLSFAAAYAGGHISK
jgi:predicted  nucleic acid-binding Zn-ribbon protein